MYGRIDRYDLYNLGQNKVKYFGQKYYYLFIGPGDHGTSTNYIIKIICWRIKYQVFVVGCKIQYHVANLLIVRLFWVGLFLELLRRRRFLLPSISFWCSISNFMFSCSFLFFSFQIQKPCKSCYMELFQVRTGK